MFCSKCGNKIDTNMAFCSQCGTKVEEAVDGALREVPVSSDHNDAASHIVNNYGALEYANFWQRAIAYIIDILIQIGIAIIILIPLMIIAGEGIAENDGLMNIISIVIGWLYFATLESSVKQSTFGKRIMGLTVVDVNGNRISFGRATGRHFAKILSVLTLLIGYIMVLFTKKRQGLHDMIAGTYVLTK